MPEQRFSRRRFTTVLGAGAIAALAGCADDEPADGNGLDDEPEDEADGEPGDETDESTDDESANDTDADDSPTEPPEDDESEDDAEVRDAPGTSREG